MGYADLCSHNERRQRLFGNIKYQDATKKIFLSRPTVSMESLPYWSPSPCFREVYYDVFPRNELPIVEGENARKTGETLTRLSESQLPPPNQHKLEPNIKRPSDISLPQTRPLPYSEYENSCRNPQTWQLCWASSITHKINTRLPVDRLLIRSLSSFTAHLSPSTWKYAVDSSLRANADRQRGRAGCLCSHSASD